MGLAISATSVVMGLLRRRSVFGALIPALFLVGCAREGAFRPGAVYSRAEEYRRVGEIPKALQQAQMGFSAWRQSPLKAWHWKFRLLTAELLLLQRDIAAATPLLQEAPSLAIPEHDWLLARLLNDRGIAAYSQKHYDEARQLLDRAYDLARKSSFQDLIAQIRIYRGYIHLALGQSGASEEEMRASVSAAELARDPYLLATALTNLGFILLQHYRYDEAIEWSERSLEISRPHGYHLLTARNLGNEGWCYYRLGDVAKAESDFAEYEARSAKLGRWEDQQRALGNLGSIHFARQDYNNAIVYYQRALASAEKFQFESQKALWLNNIATTYLDMGDLPSAESYNRQALELQSRLQDGVVSILPMLNEAQIAVGRGEYAAARQIYGNALEAAPEDPDRQWETHSGLAELYSREGDPLQAEEEYQKAAGILDTSWSSLLNNQSKLTFPSRQTLFNRSYVAFLMGQHREEQALNFVERRRARLLADTLGATPAEGGFKGLSRRSGTVLLSYFLAPEHSYLFVTTPEEVQHFPLGPEDRICGQVNRYVSGIIAGHEMPALGRELYDTLLAPARRLLPDGVHAVVSPDGCLNGLNLETLIAPTGRFWIEDATVEIAPSLWLLRLNSRAAARNHSILLIGDPIVSSMAQLPYARNEITGIASLYPGAVVKIQEDARPESYRAADPSRFWAIHFAAHAVPNRESPLDSAVVLSQGRDSSKLYAREVQDIHLSASLVTISACQSAGARTYPGEGLVGFAWAFLSAGARNVVASLWDVSDQSTAAFMQALYAGVRQEADPAAALRDVKLQFVRAQDARRKPYYWAPFQIYVQQVGVSK